MSSRVPVTYTFGNHMHWVDMEWLWGYHVLPGSVRDMLEFCRQTGSCGNINFDAIGYERLAVESPDALQELKAAVQAGTVEVVGASYGQPYGGLHGGESNVRQRVYGVRSVMRTLGVRPRAFWEEEFDFFPQLPQILSRSGFEHAALYFQWTWHTPEIPMETTPVVWWQSPDGSRVKCATRNALNLHQWPEDIQILMDQLAEGQVELAVGSVPPLILQWLELMPSADWMCRSEVLLPKTKELLADPRFEVRHATLSEYLSAVSGEDLPVREYKPDEVFHGMTLGKNGDGFRRLSRKAEHTLLSAETMATIAGRFGRPYAQWDVYPAWELEEAWRELLQAQHHDNDECEGLCGHVGKFSYERSLSLSGHVLSQNLSNLTNRIAGLEGDLIAFNPLPWPVSSTIMQADTGKAVTVEDVPALGWKKIEPETSLPATDWLITRFGVKGRRRGLEVSIDGEGRVTQITSPEWPEGLLAPDCPLLRFSMTENGEPLSFSLESMEIDQLSGNLVIRYQHPIQGGIRADLCLSADPPALDIRLTGARIRRPDGGMNAGLRTRIGIVDGVTQIVTDSPYAFHGVEGRPSARKKYPTGDWMTSPQWFEEIRDSFHSLSVVDLQAPNGAGMLVIHDGSQQWFRVGDQVENLLTCYDPWDEDYFVGEFGAGYRLMPHAGLDHRGRYRAAQEFLRSPMLVTKGNDGGDLPARYSFGSCVSEHTEITALYRETKDRGVGLNNYAGDRMADAYPIVLRVVEWNGHTSPFTLNLDGEVASAHRTNLMGEISGEVTVQGSAISGEICNHEIATVYVDLVEARKRTRDLDAHRSVWATVHRSETEG